MNTTYSSDTGLLSSTQKHLAKLLVSRGNVSCGYIRPPAISQRVCCVSKEHESRPQTARLQVEARNSSSEVGLTNCRGVALSSDREGSKVDESLNWIVFKDPLGTSETVGSTDAVTDGFDLSAHIRTSDEGAEQDNVPLPSMLADTSETVELQQPPLDRVVPGSRASNVEMASASRTQQYASSTWVRPKQSRRHRYRRAETLKEQLAACRRLPQVHLSQESSNSSFMRMDAENGASETSGNGRNVDSRSLEAPESDAGAAEGGEPTVCRGPRLTFVLPWLIVTDTKLGLREVEFLAGELGLSSLLQLDLNRMRQRRSGLWCGQYKDGKEVDRGPIVTAAAALHRLVHRRGGASYNCKDSLLGSCIVVCSEGVSLTMLANTLAAYLHWFGHLTLPDAMQATQMVVGCPASEACIAEAEEKLLQSAAERPSKLLLSWRYGGRDIKVAGEAVGGWGTSLQMRYYPRQKCWKMQLWGLAPGKYHYKFIMDGAWVVDRNAVTEYDSCGNINNVIEQVPVAESRPHKVNDTQYLLRLEAARMALDMKMRVK